MSHWFVIVEALAGEVKACDYEWSIDSVVRDQSNPSNYFVVLKSEAPVKPDFNPRPYYGAV